jgi:uncharacterized protein
VLQGNVADIEHLIWDEWNTAHIARHGIVPNEVEEVCEGRPLLRDSYNERIMVIGPTRSGRMLAIVLHPKGKGLYYPVTARPADRREREDYVEEKGGVAA